MSDLPLLESFSAALDVAQIGDVPERRKFTASEADRESLAAFLGMPGVQALSGEATAIRRGKLITVEGHLSATLTRSCVVSLEELTEEIEEDFLETFTDELPNSDLPEEMEADLDAPEPIEGGKLDLGTVLLEQLFLAMDPHPRKEGAEPQVDPKAGERISPFDVLGKLKQD
ncbi:DUF177 domain-containing protein [Parvularcula marina]|uniref:YceD family protein n=1 Tax=Parvularcula marina TaxID=2292771 RepID=UPI003515EB88